MQSTGQTSTQAVSLVSMQGSVMTKGIALSLHKKCGRVNAHASRRGSRLGHGASEAETDSAEAD